MTNLSGKKIFLLCPIFYKYTDLIIKSLSDLGLEVTYYENKMFPTDLRCSIYKPGTILRKIFNNNIRKKYEIEIINGCQNKEFDFFLSINGFSVSEKIISCIKIRNPQIKTILFLWDSLKYWKYTNILSLFDTVYSFDHADCIKYNIKYHPDFIIGQHYNCNTKIKYDVVHIGSVSIFSSHRILLLAKIKEYCIKNNISHYITILTSIPDEWKNHKLFTIIKFLTSNQHRLLFWRYYRYKRLGIFTEKKIPLSEVDNIENSAKVIIDIPPLNQQGCTIRSLEALNRGQKILTTNKSILLDEFFNENMIHIFDPNNINLHKIFNCPTERINLEELKLRNWCISILKG